MPFRLGVELPALFQALFLSMEDEEVGFYLWVGLLVIYGVGGFFYLKYEFRKLKELKEEGKNQESQISLSNSGQDHDLN